MASTTLIDNLVISDVSFIPQWRQELSRQAGGNTRIADIGPELWMAKLNAGTLTRAQSLQAEALIAQMRGSFDTFYCWNPVAPYPQADPDGTILGASTVTIYALGGDNKSLRLTGLPVGYVITIGDFMHFETGSAPVRRCLHQFVAGGVADGAGRTASIEVAPHIRAGATTTLAVTLIKPAAEMFIIPGSYNSTSPEKSFGSMSFTALQVP